jgi:hypothetical protein
VGVDAAGGAFGRGAHVHARPDCITSACKNGLSRSFRSKTTTRAEDLCAAIVEAMDRRIEGLLGAAWRGGAMAIGRDATLEAIKMSGGQVPLLVVARDAGSVAGDREVVSAVADGRAVAWGDKQRLGKLAAREEVSLLAVTSVSIAAEVASAFARGDSCKSSGSSRESREVR